MKKLEKQVKMMQNKGWSLKEKDLGTQRETILYRSDKEICIEHIRGNFDNYTISPIELREFEQAVEMVEANAQKVNEIRRMSTIQQVSLKGVEKEIFLLICKES